MKALSLIQPWTSLVAIKAKLIETRSWKTDYRGPLVIHASKRIPEECGSLCFDEPFKTALAEFFSNGMIALPTGKILAVVNLKDCFRTEEIPHDLLTDNERAFGNFAPGRYGWIFSDVRRLWQPVECNGARGLWNVPEELEKQII